MVKRNLKSISDWQVKSVSGAARLRRQKSLEHWSMIKNTYSLIRSKHTQFQWNLSLNKISQLVFVNFTSLWMYADVHWCTLMDSGGWQIKSMFRVYTKNPLVHFRSLFQRTPRSGPLHSSWVNSFLIIQCPWIYPSPVTFLLTINLFGFSLERPEVRTPLPSPL